MFAKYRSEILVIVLVGLILACVAYKATSGHTGHGTMYVTRVGPIKWGTPLMLDSLMEDGSKAIGIAYLGVDKDTNAYYNVLWRVGK